MKVLVLGGAGLQGKAVIHDLARSPEVEAIVCADINPEAIRPYLRYMDVSKVSLVKFDAGDRNRLVDMMKDADVVVDVLPASLIGMVGEAAVEAGTHVVNTMYGHAMPQALHEKAIARDVTILPEAGLDPGIDLILCGYGVSQLDEVHELHSYCGGFPEPKACDNPLNYKVTWTWHGVLLSYKRPAMIIRDRVAMHIPPSEQHAPESIGILDFPGIGKLEAVPNGNAIVFAEHLGIMSTIRNTSRCLLRWPGHSAIWKMFADLSFLSDQPVAGLPGGVTPHQFMVNHLEPKLQYKDDERDLVAMRNVIVGLKNGVETRITYDLLDQRDLETGLFAMNRTVGYTASALAQMIVRGVISKRGLLTAVRDTPYEPFLAELRQRGFVVSETIEEIG